MNQRGGGLVRRISVGAAAVALATVTVTVVVAMVPALRAVLSRVPASYASGDVLTFLPPDLHLERRNVVVFSRHDCSACQRSKAEFKKLADDIRGFRPVRLILVVPAPLNEEEVGFGRDIGFESSPLALSLGGTRLRAVPSLAVIDEHGRVLMFHEGVLTEETREKIATVAAG
jgi:hypothetical protein